MDLEDLGFPARLLVLGSHIHMGKATWCHTALRAQRCADACTKEGDSGIWNRCLIKISKYSSTSKLYHADRVDIQVS